MFYELKKSLNSILYERTISPFYGTLIVSWLIWNWKIVYLTFFISENTIKVDKITYISDNYSNIRYLVIYPLCSTFILLTIIPFISNGAYWLNLKFEMWKKDKKNQIERKQLLTLEQSLELREQLIDQEKRFEKLLEDKNLEIKQLKNINEQLDTKKTNHIKNGIAKSNGQNIDIIQIHNKITKSNDLTKEFDKLIQFIQSGYKITDRSDISSKLISLLEVNNLITPTGGGVYTLNEQGKELLRLNLNESNTVYN